VIERLMDGVTHAVGSPLMIPACVVLVGALYGLFGVDVANFTLSVGTLLLLPILQHSQNKDGAAIQAKLDALIEATPARNELIGLDRRSEAEIKDARAGPPGD
jgi:low affinity Fe/Cu permease